ETGDGPIGADWADPTVERVRHVQGAMPVEREAERGVEPGGRRRTAIAREALVGVWVRVTASRGGPVIASSLWGGWTAPGNRRDNSARGNPPDPIRPIV